MTETPNTPESVKTTTVTAKGVTEREIDGEQREVLRVPISSTRPDRENDRFDVAALEDMAAQIEREKPHVFDNHGLAGSFMEAIPYDSRETIGTQFDAEVTEAEDGEHDLFAFVNPDGTHSEGERMLKQVRDEKQAIKFSVGFGIGEEEAIEDDAGNQVGRRFLEADLMETSRVGIPANPDASLGVGAKDSGGMPPGFGMHPLFARMLGLDEDADAAAKTPTPDGGETREEKPKCDDDSECPEGQVCEDGHCVDADSASASAAEVAALRGDVNALREQVEALLDTEGSESERETKEGCTEDTDCPEGEICLEGECVPEDEVDDEDAADTEDLEALQAELDALREELTNGRGEPKTTDTATEEPDLAEEGAPDATDDAEEPDETGHETLL